MSAPERQDGAISQAASLAAFKLGQCAGSVRMHHQTGDRAALDEARSAFDEAGRQLYLVGELLKLYG